MQAGWSAPKYSRCSPFAPGNDLRDPLHLVLSVSENIQLHIWHTLWEGWTAAHGCSRSRRPKLSKQSTISGDSDVEHIVYTFLEDEQRERMHAHVVAVPKSQTNRLSKGTASYWGCSMRGYSMWAYGMLPWNTGATGHGQKLVGWHIV